MGDNQTPISWKQWSLLLFNVLAGVASIVSLCIELVSSPDRIAKYLFVQSLLMEAALLAIVCYLALALKDKSVVIKERDELKSKMNNVNHALQKLHYIPHRCRDIMVSYTKNGKSDIGIQWFQLQLNDMVDVFSAITGRQCAMCIKVLTNDNANVATLCRDSRSESRRKSFDGEARDVKSNTAFASIMHYRDQYYGNNDLPSLGSSYRNDTPRWQEFYNSAIVVPIQCGNSKDRTTVLGFLCVDALEKGGFELECHAYLLGLAADSFYLPMHQYQLMLNNKN